MNEKGEKIICRCNEVTVEEIEALIEQGVEDIEMIKRLLRIGMGPCQGRTCLPMVISILARKTGKSPDEIKLPATRIPIRPVPAGVLVGEMDEE
ncbi:(2Fe-2S)-binding protein [Thermococcus argininiproducens]|uniref:Proline dehydrogenase, delta subunit n=3 Tax=Thermococcus TaxID=2263 RepID=C6A259_THESM|nr:MULTISPECIES: (2Fe-2S)-binding protein [Thermococcus]KUK28811.1 MAG: Proline dehydrogenase, delta subunit [Thermococcus sp. 40_45]HII67575.1 (2Fe-2S)-binding protein [Thermococcaceae archaeon]ACS89704.1 Proline dehydrogenase, delta subunit [Thermococcus sibiricus MM 739]KPU62991.1 (2Fe-2S)-binding protein [Thermococcus sp. EP1]KUK17910.1 MAG: Proline dehydrogenase, delta subunit [Thermococcus sibiricus]